MAHQAIWNRVGKFGLFVLGLVALVTVIPLEAIALSVCGFYPQLFWHGLSAVMVALGLFFCLGASGAWSFERLNDQVLMSLACVVAIGGFAAVWIALAVGGMRLLN